jgi:hypothetical protein
MSITLEEAQDALRTATAMLLRRTDTSVPWPSRPQRETQIADAALAVIEWAGVVADKAGVEVETIRCPHCHQVLHRLAS